MDTVISSLFSRLAIIYHDAAIICQLMPAAVFSPPYATATTSPFQATPRCRELAPRHDSCRRYVFAATLPSQYCRHYVIDCRHGCRFTLAFSPSLIIYHWRWYFFHHDAECHYAFSQRLEAVFHATFSHFAGYLLLSHTTFRDAAIHWWRACRAILSITPFLLFSPQRADTSLIISLIAPPPSRRRRLLMSYAADAVFRRHATDYSHCRRRRHAAAAVTVYRCFRHTPISRRFFRHFRITRRRH